MFQRQRARVVARKLRELQEENPSDFNSLLGMRDGDTSSLTPGALEFFKTLASLYDELEDAVAALVGVIDGMRDDAQAAIDATGQAIPN